MTFDEKLWSSARRHVVLFHDVSCDAPASNVTVAPEKPSVEPVTDRSSRVYLAPRVKCVPDAISGVICAKAALDFECCELQVSRRSSGATIEPCEAKGSYAEESS